METPWDAQRRRPSDWDPEDPLLVEDLKTPSPPDFDDPSDSGHVSLDDEFSVPPLTTDERPVTATSDRATRGRPAPRSWRSSGSRSVSAVLIAVVLVVASMVFVGLRAVRVSFSSDQTSTDAAGQKVDSPTTVVDSDTSVSTTVSPSSTSSVGSTFDVDWDQIARSVVYFEVGGSCQWVGSGTIILDGSYVLTNWHVSGGGECPIRVGLTESASVPPTEFIPATVVLWDSQLDLAIVRFQDATGAPYTPSGRRPVTFASQEARLGENVRLLGYPVVRDDQFEMGERYTLTLTDGAVSGTEDFGEWASYNPTDSRRYEYQVWGKYIKHTAIQNGGVSGGGAFNTRGELVAVPTAGGDKLELMRSISFAKILVDQIVGQ